MFIARTVRNLGNRSEASRIGQLVEIQYVVAVTNRAANECGADEASTASDE
jgi:hypothetical protein